MLRRKHRIAIRDTARKNWIANTKEGRFDPKNPNQAALRSIRDTEAELRSGGVISSILISIAIKLATKWIEKWLEENLFAEKAPKEFSEDR